MLLSTPMLEIVISSSGKLRPRMILLLALSFDNCVEAKNKSTPLAPTEDKTFCFWFNKDVVVIFVS